MRDKLLTRCRWVAGAAVAALVAVSCGAGDRSGEGGGGQGVTLVIGGWGGAIDEATQRYYLDPFEAETGIGARFVDAPGTQLASVEAQQEAGKVEWDALDSVAGDAAWALWDKGYLEPLPADVKSELIQILGEDKVTDFGFSHANVGHVLVCNMDQVRECPTDTAGFFDPARYPGERMLGGIGPLMQLTLAEVASGTPVSETSETPIDLEAALAALERIKPYVRVFYESGDQQMQVMRSGEVDMAVMWSGRAYALKAEGMNVEIRWAGGVYEPSYWAVVKGAPHAEEAFQLLLSIAKNVEGQAGWASELHYSVPNPEAIAQLPQEIIQELADAPQNFKQIAIPNFAWYVDNLDEVNEAFADYLKG